MDPQAIHLFQWPPIPHSEAPEEQHLKRGGGSVLMVFLPLSPNLNEGQEPREDPRVEGDLVEPPEVGNGVEEGAAEDHDKVVAGKDLEQVVEDGGEPPGGEDADGGGVDDGAAGGQAQDHQAEREVLVHR